MKASPAEMLYGTTLQIPGEFFVHHDLPSDPQSFAEKHGAFMREMRPVPISHHNKIHIFKHKDLDTCSQVFVRCDHVRAPLEPLYRGSYKVVERISDRVYKLDIDGEHQNILVKRLKPAHIAEEDASSITSHSQMQHHQHTQAPNLRNIEDTPRIQRRVTFAQIPAQHTGGGVDVAAPLPAAPAPQKRRHLTGSENANQYCQHLLRNVKMLRKVQE
ncbi:uncharacterized protein LOC109862289 [Pseudomyrmex gracilis]|uniref:uncharacterized protein LOC109862289 n=1 Tax=Pseudomyrmex gracilis TaxID=219809 RepID=UPI0009954776|nr:uncharacterized protein LOC109862289 [Pseudomyrmex gracilis]